MNQILALGPLAPKPASPCPPEHVVDVLERCRPSRARAAAAARALGHAVVPQADPPAPAKPGRKPHLRVVDRTERTPAQRRRRTRLTIVGSTAVALIIALALVYLHVLLAQRQFSLDNLNARVQQEQATYQKLRLQVAELGSPENIISTAEGRLGMVQPAQVTYLSPSTTMDVPASGDQATLSQIPGQAPQGDAAWPLIKSQLAGSP